jgi:hypothetical protein
MLYKIPAMWYQMPRMLYKIPAMLYEIAAMLYKMPALLYQMPRMLYKIPAKLYQMSRMLYKIPAMLYQMSRMLYKIPAMLYQMSRMLYKIPAMLYKIRRKLNKISTSAGHRRIFSYALGAASIKGCGNRGCDWPHPLPRCGLPHPPPNTAMRWCATSPVTGLHRHIKPLTDERFQYSETGPYGPHHKGPGGKGPQLRGHAHGQPGIHAARQHAHRPHRRLQQAGAGQ